MKTPEREDAMQLLMRRLSCAFQRRRFGWFSGMGWKIPWNTRRQAVNWRFDFSLTIAQSLKRSTTVRGFQLTNASVYSMRSTG